VRMMPVDSAGVLEGQTEGCEEIVGDFGRRGASRLCRCRGGRDDERDLRVPVGVDRGPGRSGRPWVSR